MARKNSEINPLLELASKYTHSKKISSRVFTVVYTLAKEMRFGNAHKADHLKDLFGMPKQNMNYYLNKLTEEGLVTQQGAGFYSMTENGKRIYDQIERIRGKQLIRIEDMRVTYEITQGVGHLISKHKWKVNPLRNGNTVGICKINTRTVRLITNREQSIARLEVIITKVLDVHINEAYRKAVDEANIVVWELSPEVEVSDGIVTKQPEIAIPCPIASALLGNIGASQIRTNKGIMNRSKGRGADFEVTDIQKAQMIVDMPEILHDTREAILRVEDTLRILRASSFWNMAAVPFSF
ncbi:hypothetical protein [Nitrosopumilus sp.]|uniref:hypothetical protein n=1 Tax=Nitrosopumilus sp. TaxID=2024843 RepID=UPI00247BA211|nr:hypothetical protein [Nitrosopumilus sp.]MCV0410101.1 winged helix-turn-helix domain-containing protein [Nitrosopumilus sp.]